MVLWKTRSWSMNRFGWDGNVRMGIAFKDDQSHKKCTAPLSDSGEETFEGGMGGGVKF